MLLLLLSLPDASAVIDCGREAELASELAMVLDESSEALGILNSTDPSSFSILHFTRECCVSSSPSLKSATIDTLFLTIEMCVMYLILHQSWFRHFSHLSFNFFKI